MIFYDFEVFKYDWLVVLINPEKKTRDTILNDSKQLKNYYEENKNDIWVGYNSRNYDQHILKGILCDFNPYEISDFIINQENSGYRFSSLMNQIPLRNYDVMTSMHGLKQLEGYLGNNIKETSVPFDLDRKLTKEEIEETAKYCNHDVEQTIEVFIKRKEEFNSIISLINTFNLPIYYVGKTKAQLSAIILDCTKVKRNDEWDIELIDTLRIKKYKKVVDWFLDKNNYDYSKKFNCEIAGIPHVFGWGGLHGAKEKYHGTGLIIHVDVNSFYPAIMIEYDLLTRNCSNPAKYKQIRDYRLELKKQGKKKEQAPYKIVLNATYGICKDKYSTAYDPRQANRICINGQLLLLDLIEHLEVIQGFELIQSNTDGLIVKIPNTDSAFNQLDDICYEWETRTRMSLGFDYIKWISQKDVNNYIFEFDNGKLERKGAYVKDLSDLDNDLPIVNKALVDYLAKNIPVEKTINDCNELIQFQKIVKVSSKYLSGMWGGKMLNDKTFRVFASKNKNDGYIGKIKSIGATNEKFANTPDNCFIWNDSVIGVKVPNKLDKQWYIDLAKKRLEDFGV